MRLHFLFALFILLQNGAQSQQPASVQGIVLEYGTGRPLANVTVEMRVVRGPSLVIAADTRADGSFALRNVPPGTYVIEAMRAGYVPATWGEQQGAVPNQTIGPGQVLAGVSIALTPAAAVHGRLIDNRGEAVVGARIEALKTTYANGQRDRTLARTTITNDLGEYRLFMLPPGEYAVRATPPGFQIVGRPFNRLEAIPQYYPGTVDPTEARNIDLRAGESVGGIDFLSFPASTVRITGQVFGSNGDVSKVHLFPRNGSAALEQPADRVSGAFEFRNVLPGSYLLFAKSDSQQAVLPIVVSNVDVSDLRMTLGTGYEIPAVVRIEGHAAGDDPELEKLYFAVRPEPAIPGIEIALYSPFANGRFTPSLFSADYRIEITRPEDFYIKSMRLGEIDVLNQGLPVSGSSGVPLEILVGANPGSVEGQVSKGAVTVVLVPDGPRRGQQSLYKSAKVGSSGEFRFARVPPGDYKLFAWQAENGGPWLDPEYLGRYENAGIPIHVEEGTTARPGRLIPVLD